MGTSDHLMTTDGAARSALRREDCRLAMVKEIDHISGGYRKLIEAAPFVAVATSGPEGLDCSPKGDAPGFVRILDDKTLAIPDRPGNNRIDGFRNIVRDPRIALLFLIPGVGETLRVNGRAAISIDPELMQSFAVNGKLPRCVLIVHIESIYFHCSKAIVRSKLWDPSDQGRSQEPAVDRHHHRRGQPGQARRRDVRPRGAGADQGDALLSRSAAFAGSGCRSADVLALPSARASARAYAPAPARSTTTGGLFLEIGTTISRECRCSGGPPARGARAVDVVADDRPAHLGAMHAQLMRAPGQRLEREPGEAVAARPITFQVVTDGWPFGSGFIHQPRLSSSLPSGNVDAAFVGVRARLRPPPNRSCRSCRA